MNNLISAVALIGVNAAVTKFCTITTLNSSFSVILSADLDFNHRGFLFCQEIRLLLAS